MTPAQHTVQAGIRIREALSPELSAGETTVLSRRRGAIEAGTGIEPVYEALQASA